MGCSASMRPAHTLYPVRCFLPDLTGCRTTSRADRVDAELRRGWDSNPRYGVNRIHGFQPCAFDHSATSPNHITPEGSHNMANLTRREWDSNPRYRVNDKSDFESDAFDHSAIPPFNPFRASLRGPREYHGKNRSIFDHTRHRGFPR